MTTASLFVLTAALAATPDGVLLDFTASWCQPCQQMNPVVSRLQRAGMPVRKVDVDKERDLAQRCGVKNIPCFVLVVGGRVVDRRVGIASEAELRNMMARIPMREETAVAEAAPPKPPAARAAGSEQVPPIIRTSNPGPEAPKTAKSEAKPRFQFPFFRKDEPQDEPEQVAVAIEPPVIRAKFDRRDELQPTSTAFDPLASSVRILVRDDRGINFGSGTVIESRPGRSVILTCGHIFRDLRKDSAIEVDVCAGERSEKYVGQVLKFDLQADVGLLTIATDASLPVSPVAGAGRGVAVSDAVYSIGCGGGEAPSRLDLQVTALNRYLGPDNVECTGVPQQGRSGGGLFNANGEIVGVCFAANPEDQRGLYAGLKPIHALLDEAQLAHVYRRPDLDAPASGALAGRTEAAAAHELATTTGSEPARAEASTGTPAPRFEASARQIEELREVLARSGEAEVVCIIRPLDDPQAASRVVIINRASPKFVSYLTGELERQPKPTSGEIRFESPQVEKPENGEPASEPQAYRRSVADQPAPEVIAYRRSAESR